MKRCKISLGFCFLHLGFRKYSHTTLDMSFFLSLESLLSVIEQNHFSLDKYACSTPTDCSLVPVTILQQHYGLYMTILQFPYMDMKKLWGNKQTNKKQKPQTFKKSKWTECSNPKCSEIHSPAFLFPEI